MRTVVPCREPPVVPIMPGTQRLTRIFQPQRAAAGYARRWTRRRTAWRLISSANGINIVTQAPRFGTIDIEADSAIIWRGPSPAKGEPYKIAGRRFVRRRREGSRWRSISKAT